VSKTSPNVHVELQIAVAFEQETLLANDCNKQQLINILSQHMNNCNIVTKLSKGDADTDIVATALAIACRVHAYIKAII
jgi:hypothetical protein